MREWFDGAGSETAKPSVPMDTGPIEEEAASGATL